MTRRRSFTAAAIVLVLVAGGAEAAVSVHSGFSSAVVAGGLSQPTAMAFDWTPTNSDAGTHSFQVWVGAAGSSAAYDAWAPFGPVVIVP